MITGSYLYALLATSIGWVGVVARPDALVWIAIDPDRDELLAKLKRQFPTARETGQVGLAADACQQLEQYFRGELQSFDLPLDWSGHTEFTCAVLRQLAQIPFGETLTYGELAARAGYPGGARAVGRVMANNRLPLVLPCHRVVGSGGRLTGYSGGEGIKTKRRLLDLEKDLLMKNR